MARAAKSGSAERAAGARRGTRSRAGVARRTAPATSAQAPSRGAVFERVYAIVRRIPRGRVMTYGQISRRMRGRLSAAAVGWAMYGCPGDVPWQRVVNAAGGCSTDAIGPHPAGWQRSLLEAEGVEFGLEGRLDLARYRGGSDRRAPAAGRTSPRRRK